MQATERQFASKTRGRPFYARLSELAHGGEPRGEVVATLVGLEPMGEHDRGVWIDLLWAGLNEAARNALEKAVNVNDFKEQLPFYKEGLGRGLDLGITQGRKEGLRAAVETARELLSIELTDARKAHLAGLDVAGLEALRQHLKQHRAWPG